MLFLIGALHEFDLNTYHRKLVDYSKVDLCNGTDTVEGDKVSEFLMRYLTKTLKLKPAMFEDTNPINYEKVPTKLLTNLRKNPTKPGMYEATLTLYKEMDITFEHRLTPINDIFFTYMGGSCTSCTLF